MWVMETLPFIRRRAIEREPVSPWAERRALLREVSWQERMTKVGATEVDRCRAHEALKGLRKDLLAAESRVASLNRSLVGWVVVAAAAAVSFVLNGRAILTLILR